MTPLALVASREALPHPLLPRPCRVTARRQETADVVSLLLEPLDGALTPARPGQFHMLSAPGVGEAAISVSGAEEDAVRHTVRDVGPVSHALCAASPGDVLGVRGPFGTDWALEDAGEADVVVVAGGIGLAPLATALDALAARQHAGGGRLFLAVGARTPDQLLYPADLEAWAAAGARVAVTVDAAPQGWGGTVGVVTSLLPELGFSATSALALVCGPEVMIRFTARDLVALGVAPGRVRVSLERNMQCGVGLCGHCQLGPLLLCRDGPVVAYDVVARLLAEPER